MKDINSVKDIVVKLKQTDGTVKKYSRPATNVLELQEFQELQRKIDKSYPHIDANDPKFAEKWRAVDWKELERNNVDEQIEFIVKMFKNHDAFTIEEFKIGTPSYLLKDTIVDVFSQIAPWDFEEEKKPEKKSRSRNGKKA